MDMLILHKGQVTHVIDPSSFWMRMGTDTDFQMFDEYQNALNKFYNGTGRTDVVSADTLTLGDCVIVADTSQTQINDGEHGDGDNKAEFHWNRARVSRIDEDKVDVFYIDLGYTEIVHISRINNINSDLFYYLPSQVIQVKLVGIRQLSRSWTSRAINRFASRVLDQEVLVSLIDYDEVSKYGQVVLYIQCESSRWRCLTHDLLDEDLGLPVEPIPEEFLSQEEVIAALVRGEQDCSLNACGLDSCRNEDDEVAPNETESRENLSLLEPGPSTSFCEPDQHLRLDSFSTPVLPDHSSSNYESAAAQVPAFDLSSFVHTKSLCVSKMHEDKVEEQRLLTRTRLEQELEDSEEGDGDEQEIDWGKSDLRIGEADVFSDFDNIRQEIYKHHSDHPSGNDFHEFFYKVTGIHKESPLAKSPVMEKEKENEDTQRGSSGEVELKPLTEIEDYEIQKKIEEILSGKDSGELNMVCVLINSIIEPDVAVPCDRLVAVFTAILERMVRNSDTDPLIAFSALETYLGTSAFEAAIDTVLKTLRSNFVKLPQSKHSSILYCAFAEFLVALFIRSGNWPASSSLLVHEFVMASLERWVVFNKQRMQSSESSMCVEQLYLECVEVFIDGAGKILSQRFPDRCCSLLEEIKYKLLHDGTQRIIREQLLNILLKLHRETALSTPKKTSGSGDLSAQTEAILDFRSTKDTGVSGQPHLAVEEDMTTTNNLDIYGPAVRRGPPSTGSNTSSSWSDEDFEAGGHSMYSTDVKFDVNSFDSVAGGNIADRRSSSAPVACGASSHSSLMGNNTTLSKVTQRVAPHLQKEGFQDDGFKNYMTAATKSDDSQQARDELNVVAELTCSTSQNALEQQGKKQFGSRLEAHDTKEERYNLSHSKPFDVATFKQNQVHRLNISASEFTPKQSSSWGELDQVKMSVSSIDVLGYRTDRISISGGINSELIKPIQFNGQNENAVAGIQKVESFLEVGKEEEGRKQQRDASENNDETCTAGSPYFSDIEEASEHSEPSPENAVGSVGMVHQEKIIRYTRQELKALNPGASGCPIDLNVTSDSSSANIIVKKPEHQPDEQETADFKSSPSAVPYLRYTGIGNSPLEISVGPKSNSAKWKSLSELLPPSQLRPCQYNTETSIRPPPFSCDIGDADPRLSEKDNPNSLYSIAESLFSTTDQSVSQKHYSGCDKSKPVVGEHLETEAVKNFDTAEARTVTGLNDDRQNGVPQWPEELFKSVGSIEDNTLSTSIVPLSPKKIGKRKAKKKTKFRPVSEVLAEKSGNDCHENKTWLPDMDDEQCRSETEVEDAEVGGHIVHQPKLGALCSSYSKRSSWLTEQRQVRSKADKWVPGRRKCTRCGSTDHTIYDCSQEDPFRKPSNQIYFL